MTAPDDDVPYAWLLPEVLAGGPHPERADRLAMATLHSTFDAVLTALEEPLHRRLVAAWGLRHYLWLRTDDGDPPHLGDACAFIDRARADGVATLVHCYAGIGRTGTILAAYLLPTDVVTSAVEARDQVRRDYCPHAVESAAQMAALATFARRRRR